MKIVINPIRPALSDLDQDFHVLVRLQSEPQAGFQRTPLNLAIVIDRSGSMQGPKLREAKRCVVDLIQRMHSEDQVGLVQYDDQVDTVLPLTAVGQLSGIIDSLVQGITANGGTDLHAGWLRGGEMLAPKAGNQSTCHTILLSDGQTNRGLTNTARICEQVSALAGAGVTTTTVGLGADFNEELMTAIAQAGHGSAHYGERAIDLAETFEAEISLLSQLQWRNVEMSISGESTHIEILNTYQRAGEGWRMPSVALGSECWALFRMPMREAIRLQAENGSALKVNVQAVDANVEKFSFEGQLQSLPVVAPDVYLAELGHELVERRINELNAARLQMEIRDAALRGDWLQVEQLLNRLETIGRHEPWVAASIAFTRQLMSERDERRMSKEMLYKSRKMNSRLSSTDEMIFSMKDDFEMPAFLRRKSTEGRRSET
uniref:vWA domain-containing protein n=1 Tax=Limnohabitans sp. TaxID=1907725 RepID=UPI004047E0CC